MATERRAGAPDLRLRRRRFALHLLTSCCSTAAASALDCDTSFGASVLWLVLTLLSQGPAFGVLVAGLHFVSQLGVVRSATRDVNVLDAFGMYVRPGIDRKLMSELEVLLSDDDVTLSLSKLSETLSLDDVTKSEEENESACSHSQDEGGSAWRSLSAS